MKKFNHTPLLLLCASRRGPASHVAYGFGLLLSSQVLSQPLLRITPADE